MIFLSKMHDYNLVMRKLHTNPNWKTFYKVNRLLFSKVSRPRKLNRGILNETEEINVLQVFALNSFALKDIM